MFLVVVLFPLLLSRYTVSVHKKYMHYYEGLNGVVAFTVIG